MAPLPMDKALGIFVRVSLLQPVRHLLPTDEVDIPLLLGHLDHGQEAVRPVLVELDGVKLAGDVQPLDVAFICLPQRVLGTVRKHTGDFVLEICQSVQLEEIFGNVGPRRRDRYAQRKENVNPVSF